MSHNTLDYERRPLDEERRRRRNKVLLTLYLAGILGAVALLALLMGFA